MNALFPLRVTIESKSGLKMADDRTRAMLHGFDATGCAVLQLDDGEIIRDTCQWWTIRAIPTPQSKSEVKP